MYLFYFSSFAFCSYCKNLQCSAVDGLVVTLFLCRTLYVVFLPWRRCMYTRSYPDPSHCPTTHRVSPSVSQTLFDCYPNDGHEP